MPLFLCSSQKAGLLRILRNIRNPKGEFTCISKSFQNSKTLLTVVVLDQGCELLFGAELAGSHRAELTVLADSDAHGVGHLVRSELAILEQLLLHATGPAVMEADFVLAQCSVGDTRRHWHSLSAVGHREGPVFDVGISKQADGTVAFPGGILNGFVGPIHVHLLIGLNQGLLATRVGRLQIFLLVPPVFSLFTVPSLVHVCVRGWWLLSVLRVHDKVFNSTPLIGMVRDSPTFIQHDVLFAVERGVDQVPLNQRIEH